MLSGASKAEAVPSDYVDDDGGPLAFTTFTMVKGVNKGLGEDLVRQSLDGCFTKAAAAANKIMQAKAYGAFALDETKSLTIVAMASERLVSPAQQQALAALGVTGAIWRQHRAVSVLGPRPSVNT